MEKSSAAKIVSQTFQNPFNKDSFVYFIKSLLNHIEPAPFVYRGKYIPDAYKPYIKTLERIGKYQDKNDKKIDLLIVHLKKETSLERARTMQRNFIAWYLNGSRGDILKDAALVAFVSPNSDDWRFSLVKMDYRLDTSEKKVKVKQELTPARRFSFLVGKTESSHTAQSCLAPILQDDDSDPTLKDLEDTFSIEKVTKEFFEKYRDLFLKVKEALDEIVEKNKRVKQDFEKNNIDTVNFAKKLLGQIVFLYFLQKKGWFGVERDEDWGTGPKNFLRLLFEKRIAKYDNFFNDILEPLFYEALAIERTDDFYSRFNCKIPFLNGGLFDPINNYDWIHIDILLSNDLFSNTTKTKEGDVGTGILDIFDRYNFTVKEDEPLEKEVAIDPEMLGKVFENLLEVKDRKSKGTYYTPREIVHYMCQQGLINYLATELKNKVKKEDIETLIKYGETVVEHDSRVVKRGKETKTYSFKLPKSIRDNTKLIDEKLTSIRVCDPAVGSGAFPVGMMNEVVRTRNALTNYIKRKKDKTIYDFKRHAIQNCLYGVDIDPGAVEITKLRLWLSLIVDEENIKQIKPLPNLDYKIMQGNSLLGVEKRGEDDMFYVQKIEKLKELKNQYFSETNISEKNKFKKQINNLINKITNNHKDFDFEVYFSEVFHEKKGFDVVIANPPYIGEKEHKEIFREIKQNPLGKFYHGKMDIFYFFFHLALNLIHQNSEIAFITTNYYPTAYGAKRLREDFKERAIVRYLINFNELKIFESAKGQHNMITILSKDNNKSEITKTAITKRTGVATSETLQKILSWKDSETLYYKVKQKDLYDGEECYIRLFGNSGVSENPVHVVLDKVKKQGQPLGIICNVNNGIFAGADSLNENKKKKYKITNANAGDGIFILTKKEVDNLNLEANERMLFKPLFKNSGIYRYSTSSENNLFIINLRYTDRPNIDDYPNIKKHLIKFKSLLSDRPRTGTLESAFNNGYWYVMSTSRRVNMDSAKIVVPQRSPRNTFGYNEIPWYASADVYFITQKDGSVSLKYLLALLNSKLYYLWLYHRGKRKGEMLELYQKPLSEIPIKKISESEQKPFIDLVDQILAITSAPGYDSKNPPEEQKKIEDEIDQLVYKLYGLTLKEIKIVEAS